MMWRIIELLFAILFITCIFGRVHSKPRVPCYFIFGDSLSDVGNNNDLKTRAKVNYPPYGIDFPGGIATGRFSNGLNFVDRITQLLEFNEFIPASSQAKSNEIYKGVNYASGSAGIRAETGQHLGDRMSMDRQLENHLVTVTKLTLMGKGDMLKKCLYTVNMGNNDYIGYFLPQYYPTSSLYNTEQFAEVLLSQYDQQLTTLYTYGARKVALFGVGQIGCTLGEISMHGIKNASVCVEDMSNAVQLFNQKLISLVDDLNTRLPGAQFTYISSGSTDTDHAIANSTCCEVRSDYQCKKFGKTCEERGNYIFWDGFHTTEKTNIATAERAYNAVDSNHVHPMDINTLLSNDNEIINNGYVSSSK